MSSVAVAFIIALTSIALKAEAKLSETRLFNCESYEPQCEDPVRGDNDDSDNPPDQSDEGRAGL